MSTHLFPTDEIPLPGGFFQKTSAVATKITFPPEKFPVFLDEAGFRVS